MYSTVITVLDRPDLEGRNNQLLENYETFQALAEIRVTY